MDQVRLGVVEHPLELRAGFRVVVFAHDAIRHASRRGARAQELHVESIRIAVPRGHFDGRAMAARHRCHDANVMSAIAQAECGPPHELLRAARGQRRKLMQREDNLHGTLSGIRERRVSRARRCRRLPACRRQGFVASSCAW